MPRYPVFRNVNPSCIDKQGVCMHAASLKSGLVSVIVVLGMTLAPASALAQGEVTIGGPFEGEAGTLNGAGGRSQRRFIRSGSPSIRISLT
jgi:hypothetical protein